MREIKFRAKYKSGKKWSYFTLKELIENDGVMFDNYHSWGQFTCLKDKNGKEIYEGDIVKTFKLLDNIIGEVRWVKHKLTYDVLPKDWNSGEDLYHLQGYIEIIGNIYENPELLKGINKK